MRRSAVTGEPSGTSKLESATHRPAFSTFEPLVQSALTTFDSFDRYCYYFFLRLFTSYYK